MSAQLPFNILNRLFLGEHFHRTKLVLTRQSTLSLVSLLRAFVCFHFHLLSLVKLTRFVEILHYFATLSSFFFDIT